ncbi:MAG: methylated-DNA-[protein]-cysteine S-methyltransferase [Frankiaceae bacterium]|jgi:methylated-DNA-[protein]-cysteine S-methyltransferase|nr:methylated-DNA-[protein]-cysteine S-methyltransferase [Frankiaceae bacterium]
MTTDLLAAVPAPDAATNDRLTARLTEAAAAEQLLDVAYRLLDSPLGPVLVAATPAGLVRVAYAVEDHDAVLTQLAATVSPRVLHAPGRLDTVATELDEYFNGKRQRFDLPLDLQLSKGFRRTILTHLQDIGYGRTASYTAVAAAAGNPKAVRAVGTACAMNPVPIVVPCHRVLRSDGSVGQYLGGTAAKRALLALEADAVAA